LSNERLLTIIVLFWSMWRVIERCPWTS
jgi:hypothetical protein